jgi:hypothetical protein
VARFRLLQVADASQGISQIEGEPNEDAIGNERDVAKDAENAQEALRHEGQEYHCRS